MKISKITESNVLSLWLGTIGDFGELDEYIWNNFEHDFGLKFGGRTAPEIDAQEEAKSVRELIDGFSFCEQWMNNALSVCEQSGWSEANCAVVFFNVRYPKELAAKFFSSNFLTFIGNIEWDAH